MAKQKLGTKKHKKCESITNRKYIICLTRGGCEHFTACCIADHHIGTNHDLVNYKTGNHELDVNVHIDLTKCFSLPITREDIYKGNIDNKSRMDYVNKKLKEKDIKIYGKDLTHFKENQ